MFFCKQKNKKDLNGDYSINKKKEKSQDFKKMLAISKACLQTEFPSLLPSIRSV